MRNGGIKIRASLLIVEKTNGVIPRSKTEVFYGTLEKPKTQIKARYCLNLNIIAVNVLILHQIKSGTNAGNLNERERGQIVGVGWLIPWE